MNKKILSAILFGALMVTSTGTFVSCKDYDDDIDKINSELVELKSAISSLQKIVDDGSFVTGVAKTADGKGITFTFSKGNPVTITLDGNAAGNGSVVTVDPTTGELKIDGKGTNIFPAKDPAKAPVKVENGFWYFLGENGEYTNSNIPVKGAYVVDQNSYWILNVPNADGVYQTINLPKTSPIASLKAVTVTSATNKIADGADVLMTYGQKLGTEVKFNNKTYAKETILLSQVSALSAVVNPLDADAKLYAYSLVDSKGNRPFVISDVKANETDKALSRAATANKGVFDMAVAYTSTDKCGKSAGLYSLSTTTANGEVASAYDVTVKEKEVTGVTVGTLKALSVDINKDLDLTGCFKNANIATVNTDAPEGDLTPYIVDYYFELGDKTAAANLGVTLDGKTIKATKAGTYTVKVNYLLVNGTKVEGATAKDLTVTFNYVAPSTELADVEWTVTNAANKNIVYLSLSSIQASLAGATDGAMPSINTVSTTWTDGKALDEKTVTVNDVKYGKDGDATHKFANNEATWITTVATGVFQKKTDGSFENGASIQKELYAKFTFTATTAFPGEYIVNVGFKKSGNTTANNDLVVPVKVVIKSPATTDVSPFKRLAAYFSGDNATAYGTLGTGVVTYNMFDLYKDMGTEAANVVFSETKHEIENHTCASWIVTNGNISVGIFDNTEDADNKDKVYSTREMKAAYTVFGNVHIAKITDKFNLTVKSEIAEGTLEATAASAASGNGVDPIYVSLKDITAKDVYGKAYNLATTYKKATAGADKDKFVDEDNTADSRLTSVEIVLADDNAKQYLAIVDQNTTTAGIQYFAPSTTDAYSKFAVQKKSSTTVLVEDVVCKVAIKVTDKWGKITTTEVSITLKK